MEPQSTKGFVSSRTLTIGLIQFELLLGIWLLSGLRFRICRRVAIVVFSLFAIVALLKGLSGESFCGCFGRVQISPWWNLGIDLVALASLIKWEPNTFLPSRGRLAASVLVAFMACGVSPSLILTGKYLRFSGGSLNPSSGQLVVIEPETWVGRSLPIIKHIDVGSQLDSGMWIILLYHHNCPKCQEALPKYQDLAARLSRGSSEKSIALVEVPPCGAASPNSTHDNFALYGRLAEPYKWFVQAPVGITLEDGVVMTASTELPCVGTPSYAESLANPVLVGSFERL